MSGTTDKLTAAIFALVMVLSVLATGTASAGAVAPSDSDYPEVSSDIFDSSGVDGVDTGDTPTTTDRQGDADIEDGLLEEAEGGTVTAVVRLEEMDRWSQLTGDRDAVVSQLKTHAERTQQPVVDAAANLDGVTVVNQLWIANAIVVEADAEGLEALARVPGVDRIHRNFELTVPEAQQSGTESGDHSGSDAAREDDVSADQYTYGLDMINAPQVWDEFGTKGKGARVAILGTGYDNGHTDLPKIHPDDQWQEFDDLGIPVDSDPYDTHGGGTHASGIVVGTDEPDVVPHAFGVAPEATLYHALVIPNGTGTFAQVIAGMQHAVDEWKVDVLGMGLNVSGYSDPLIEPSENARDAGTILTTSIGNNGAGTSGSPGNVYPNFASGAVDANGQVTSFSGGEEIDTDFDWGSSASDYWPDTYVVPDAAAPGVNICSAVPGDGYDCTFTGTAEAQAHMAGLFALLVSHAGEDADREQLIDIVEQTASQPSLAPPEDPNTRYGHGIVDAYAAVNGIERGTSAVNIIVNNPPLIAGQGTVFYADSSGIDAPVSSFTWEFGDGTTATGQSVTHAYTAAGDYTITLSVETNAGKQFTTTRDVTVDPAMATFDISSITPQVGNIALEEYTHIEGFDPDLSYVVSVTQPSSTANVTFELGGLTHTDTDGSDGWQFPVPADQLTSNETLTVTAYGTNGQKAVDSTSVSVIETPEWFDLLDPVKQFKRRPIVEFTGTFPSGDGSSVQLPNSFPFADDISLPIVGSSQSNDVEVTVTVRINLRTTEAVVAVGGQTDYSVSNRVSVSGSVSGSASMHLYKMDIVGGKLTASGNAEIEVPPTGIPNPPIGPVPPGIVRLYPIFGIQVDADAEFDELDSVGGTNPVAFELTDGSIVPELYAKQELGQKLEVAELVFGLEEGINADVPLPSFDPIYGNAFAQAYLRARAGPFTYRLSYPPGSDRFSYQFGPLFDSNAAGEFAGTPTSRSSPTIAWQPVDRTGPAPPERRTPDRVATTGADSTTPVVSPDALTSTRITNNTVADKTPALARTGSDGVTLVWSQQQADSSVFNGREILASNSTDGTSFAGPTSVTDDNVSDYYPAIAASDDDPDSALAAFTTFDRTFNGSNVTEPDDIYPYGEIRVARLDDSGWESPTLLTNDSAFDFGPTVVSSGDNWTIAWTRDTDANLSTWQDREVAYVRYDGGGQLGPIHSIDGARSPVLATIGNLTRIAYLDMQSGEASGQLVIGDLQPGQSSPVTQASYAVDNLTDVAAANDTVAWTTSDAEPWMQVATTDGVRNLSASDGLTPPQSVGLGAQSDRLLLTFRAASPTSSVAESYYKPRVDGVWLPARKYASGADRNLTYWQTTTVGTVDGFNSVAAGKVLNTDQKDDLFAFRTQFRSDLAVSVRDQPGNVTVGDPVNLTVAVTNTGDIPTNATTVTASNSSGVVATSSVPALQPGASVERSLTAVLDDSGQVTVEVDPSGKIQEHDETNNVETVRLQRPDLTVTDRTITLLNGTVRVNATIANPSPIAAPAVTYRYSNGPTLNRSGTVGPIPPGSTRQISADFVPTTLSSDSPLTISVDATGTLPESDETNNTLVGPIRKPNVELSADQVNYYRQNGTIGAAILVKNTGSGAGEGTIRVSYAANGTVIASQPFDVEPAWTTGSGAFTQEYVVLPGVSENATLTITANVRPQNTTSPIVDSAATSDTVELNTTLLPPTGSLRLSRTLAVFNHTLLVSVSATDPDGTVTGYNWTVTNGTISGNTTDEIVTIVPDNVSRLSVGVKLTDDDGLTQQVVRTVDVTRKQTPVVADYANEQGVVDPAGLLDAIRDWRAAEVDTTLLLDVVDAWRRGDPLV